MPTKMGHGDTREGGYGAGNNIHMVRECPGQGSIRRGTSTRGDREREVPLGLNTNITKSVEFINKMLPNL